MVTESEYIYNGKYMGAAVLYGLSSDSKPTTYGNGSKFTEVDTGKVYYFDAAGGEWHTEGETPAETPDETTPETKTVTATKSSKTTTKK